MMDTKISQSVHDYECEIFSSGLNPEIVVCRCQERREYKDESTIMLRLVGLGVWG